MNWSNFFKNLLKIKIQRNESDTYSIRGGSFGTKIETSASCGSQLPPEPYFSSMASNSDGIFIYFSKQKSSSDKTFSSKLFA